MMRERVTGDDTYCFFVEKTTAHWERSEGTSDRTRERSE
jgi:hypothetical protein